MVSLPKSFKLDEPIPSLPEGSNGCLISCRPISSSTYGAGGVIDVDLGSRGWLDPKSLAIRYTMAITAGATATAMIGTPCYTPFNRLSITANGTTIDSISQYNQVAHVLTNGSMDVASKFGRQYAYGYSSSLPPTTNIQNLDARVSAVTATDTFSVACPLPCLLSNSEKSIPLFAVGNMRLTFTIDTLANMFATGAMVANYAVATGFLISNFEVVYNMIDLGAEVERMVRGMGSRLFLKSHSYNNSATAVGVGTTGSQSFVFNQRYSSIRSAFLLPNLTIGSKWAEICDITANAGDYQLQIGNSAYPQMPLSALNNKGGILQETYRAFGNLYDNNSMSIDGVEFQITSSTLLGALNPYEPGKFIIGQNLEKCQNSDHVLMSGVSTYNSPISAVINMPTATVGLCNLNLMLDYDAIIVIDQESKQLSVRS
jgi:hypothetical protein